MASRSAALSTSALVLAGALGMLSGPSCLERRHDDSAPDARCASCHGDPRRSGDVLERAAPPRDLLGQSDARYPGVGAHQIHLSATATHGALACAECHVVPERTESPGHADDDRPAEVVFGELATRAGHDPAYDAVTRRCDNSYCHGDAKAVWTEPRDSAEACGSCHGLPPAAPHPQAERCDACHGEVIDAERRFVEPALHVNGTVETTDGGCTVCHGDDTPAPPPDLAGNDDPSELGVGAHAVHLSGGRFSRPLACAECHRVPDAADDPDHADGPPTEVSIEGVGEAHGRAPLWLRDLARCSDTYCHGPSPSTAQTLSPAWNEPGQLGCGSCHELPPPAPHPQMDDCSLCHADVVAGDDRTIVSTMLHVDGQVNVEFDSACTACHGSGNSAPPRDLDAQTATTAPGVGAHQAHIEGSGRARAVPCAECHLVPDDVLDQGHLDSARPAELVFSGAAVAFGASPAYAGGACSGTPCHGAAFPDGNDSGGSHTLPSWTLVDGSQITCGSCHGLPPPAPHPYYSSDCSACHENVADDDQSFVRPELHVDGVVTFRLP